LEREKPRKGAVRVAPGRGGRSLWVFGELVTYKVTGDQTGGAYSLFEIATRPGGGPPPHVNHREDVAFWVLEGEYDLSCEGAVARSGPGSLVFVRRGNLHAYRNVGDGWGRVLATYTPGGSHERFFEQVGERADAQDPPPADAPPADPEGLAAIAARYGIEMLPLEGARDAGDSGRNGSGGSVGRSGGGDG